MSRRHHVRFAHPVGLAAVAGLLAACGLTPFQGPRSFSGAAMDTEGHTTIVSVTDRSGKVLDVDFGPLDAHLAPGAAAVPGAPSELDLGWVGGQCDASTTIDIAGAGAGLAVTIQVVPDARPCDAIGVAKVIRLKLTQPVPPAMVQITQ
jgi:hypothetical protein